MPNFTDTAPVVDLPCPVCDRGGARRMVAETVWGAPEARVYQCTGCSIVFIHPIMSDDEQADFYEARFAHYMRERGGPGETEPSQHFAANVGEAQRRITHLLPILEPGMEVLEIGSSTGFLLDTVRPHVKSVAGVEPGEAYAAYANTQGLTTYRDMRGIEGRRFDLVMAYYVVEHLPKPVEQLERFRSLLKPGGTLAVEVPNVDDALVTFYQVAAFDRFYWQKAHFFNYSPRTMEMVMQMSGFGEIELIPDQRYDISNHFHWLAFGLPGGKGKYSHIFDERLNLEYQRCLREKWICDTVFALARNPEVSG